MSADHALVVAIAVSSILVVGGGGAVLMRGLRQHSVRFQLVVIPVVAMVSVAVAVLVDARVMFLSGHDSGVVVLTLVAAMPLALALAAWSGRDLARSAWLLRQAADQLAQGLPAEPPSVTSQELRHVGEALHRAGRDLAASREREQAAEASRRDLVAWVSHDLRTPLAGIRAMAEALEDGVVDDPGDYLKRLQVEAGRLSSMVDTLFLLSRLHAGALRLVREPLPVGDLVSDAVASIQPTASVRDVAIIGGADPEAVAAVDAGQLSRALSNLLVNAVRHTPPSGTVQVSAGCVGEQVVLAVQDQCGGIPEQELHRVFDVAWRGAGQRSHGPDGGGGLGLAITRGIVEAHAGTVEVRNTGTGCRFEIRMPRHTQA